MTEHCKACVKAREEFWEAQGKETYIEEHNAELQKAKEETEKKLEEWQKACYCKQCIKAMTE